MAMGMGMKMDREIGMEMGMEMAINLKRSGAGARASNGAERERGFLLGI